MTDDPYMKDYFFNSKRNKKLKHARTYSNMLNRQSSFNLSGSEIVYNNNNNKNLIVSRLKNNNILAHRQLDEINNEYNNMKNFLNDKVSKLEQQQQKQFEALKNYLDENNQLKDLLQKDNYSNKMINEINAQLDYEIYKKKNLEKIRKADYEERLGRKKAEENLEKEKLLKEMEYYEKIKRLDYMEKILSYKNKMRKRVEEMYQNPFSPYYFNSHFMSPLLLDLINAKNNNNKQNEIFKLFLLKSIMDDDKSKKDRPLFAKPPKYFIQKYYPPAPSTNVIPVPQPILFKSPDPPPPQVIYQRGPIRMMPSQRDKNRHSTTGQSETNSKNKTGEESSEPEIRLRIHDPDNPDNDQIIYPENTQE